MDSWRCPFKDCSIHHDGDDLYEHLTRVHGLSHEQVQAYENKLGRSRALWKLEQQVGSQARQWTLETFPGNDAAGRRALEQARRWVEPTTEENWPGNSWPGSLFIYGPVGSGKTGLAIGIAREIIEQTYADNHGDQDWYSEIEFANVRALLETQRERFARGESKNIEHLLETSETAVILDDLGAERPTEFALETISLIVERRHANNGTTIVTSNYAPSALAHRLGHEDPVVGQRIVSRLLQDALKIKLDRADLRMRRNAA
jgi:DNA replication protein DnaC